MSESIEKQIKILIIDDEAPIRDVLSANLNDDGYIVETASDGHSGLLALQSFKPDICFLDIWMPGKMDGIEVLKRARSEFPLVEFVMISGHGTIETAVKATKLGAWDFIEKPLSMDKITIIISNILNYLFEKEEKNLLLNKLRRSIALIGDSLSVVQAKSLIAEVATHSRPLLISGEKGVGKKLVAQNIHYMSAHASRPFVDLNCNAVPSELLESEIFGIEKGAMPGVERVKTGKIDWAQGGTLYLSEVGLLPLAAQERLLHFLKTKNYQRVGGGVVLQSDVRIIVATTIPMKDLCIEGSFLRELHEYINVTPFEVQSLRNHAEDIPGLISYFSDSIARETGVVRKMFSETGLQRMIQYSWPGNVRELKNFIERVYILTPSDFVDVHDLLFAGLSEDSSGKEGGAFYDEFQSFREARAVFEKEYLVRKITENSGNISKTAEMIGLERSYLHRKMKTYGIESKEMRNQDEPS